MWNEIKTKLEESQIIWMLIYFPVGVPPKILEPLSDVVVIAPKDAILECDLELGEPESDIKW